MKAVVFAYHDVGVRCLQVLLAQGVEVALVVTHADNPAENIWFSSVQHLCRQHGIQTTIPDQPDAALEERIAALKPDFIFSFYYRHMIPVSILQLAPAGAYNMHGSLLPRYRGRVPVNWAVLHGETETGATLHEMLEKPDAGAIAGQTAVPILPDDTAYQVFGKVVTAAEITLWQTLPLLLAGNRTRQPNPLIKGQYFGGRRPEDGRVNWQQTGAEIYNLYRAVAPPYPGAFTDVAGERLILARAHRTPGMTFGRAGLHIAADQIYCAGSDGAAFAVDELRCASGPVDAAALRALLAVQGLQGTSEP